MSDIMKMLEQGRPIPGESLTANPDTPMPYERPPEFTNFEKAQKYVVETLTDSNTAVEMIRAVSEGIPVDMLAMQFLFAGFSNGKWTPDLLLLLIEPTIYTILFLCEQAGVDYDFYFEDASPEATHKFESHLAKMFEKQVGSMNKEGGLSEIESLLSKPVELNEVMQ